jgi:hypothetical protein
MVYRALWSSTFVKLNLYHSPKGRKLPNLPGPGSVRACMAAMAKGGSTPHLAFHAMAQQFGAIVRYRYNKIKKVKFY